MAKKGLHGPTDDSVLVYIPPCHPLLPRATGPLQHPLSVVFGDFLFFGLVLTKLNDGFRVASEVTLILSLGPGFSGSHGSVS